jgi:P-type conjugative transfer protein VirB9
VFPIILHNGFHTHIDLPKNEHIQLITLGNLADWEIENKENKIFLQTHSKNAKTNMTIITSKRTYEFELIARPHTNENDYELAYAIKFFYPEESNYLGNMNYNHDRKNNVMNINDIIRGKINTNYVFYGKSELSPIVAFNDSRFTYIKFKDGMIPKVKLYDKDNKKLKANIFLYNNYLIIDKILLKIKFIMKNDCVVLINKNLI